MAVAAHCGIQIHGDRIQVSFPLRQYRAWAVAPASSVRGEEPDLTEGSGASESGAETPPVGDAEPERDEEADEAGDDSEADDAIRRTLRPDPQSLQHFLTHQPAAPKDCEACMRGKTKNRRKLAGQSTRDPQEFGDLVTVDHVYMRDWHGRPGLGGVHRLPNRARCRNGV